MNISLVGKRALVCGSTSGIGKASAETLAILGANVVLMARNEEKLYEVCKNLPVNGKQKHHYLKADFTFPPEVKLAIEEFLSFDNEIDILVNNTGGPKSRLAIEANPEEFKQAFSQHLLCYQVLVQSIVPGMKKNSFGRIINIVSTSVKQPLPGLGVSNTIRGAVASWSKTLANELGQYNITVNNVLPGATDTSRLQSLIKSNAQRNGRSESEELNDIIATIPLKRIATPKEIANAVGFLASPAADYINGINLPVDGGRMKSL